MICYMHMHIYNIYIYNCIGLKSHEVNFSYIEDDVSKNALVKLRLCEECAVKLNYTRKDKEKKKSKKSKKKEKSSKKERKRSDIDVTNSDCNVSELSTGDKRSIITTEASLRLPKSPLKHCESDGVLDNGKRKRRDQEDEINEVVDSLIV